MKNDARGFFGTVYFENIGKKSLVDGKKTYRNKIYSWVINKK